MVRKTHGFRKFLKHPSSKRGWVGVTVVCALLILLALEFTNTTHLLHKQKAVSGTIPSTTTKAPAPSSSQNTTAPSTTGTSSVSGSPKYSAPVAPNGALVTPFGTFVSNHKPSLGGTSAPSQEQSVCSTSLGATCVIQFVNNDGVTKTLPAQTVGSSGSVIWNWDVKQAGFSQGSWRITATASLNGQTKTTTDTLPMQVQP